MPSHKTKINQAQSNKFEFSDTNKRYYTYDYYLRRTFGGKCAKLPLDIGLICPNIDGRVARGGCIYCSSRGSGDFAASPCLSVTEQLKSAKAALSSKWQTDKYIAYFQAHTNTYAPLEFLREKFEEALRFDGVVGLNIATRADCLEDDTVKYLAELAERTVLTVELGLQSVHDSTAALINRGHDFAEFERGFYKLREASEKINICVHLIFGLPGENREMMLDSVNKTARLHPDQVKFHLLHLLKGTQLAEWYRRGEYTPMQREDYIETVVCAIELLPSDTVVCRLTGDGMGSELLAPEWSRRKTTVINDIDKLLFAENSYQGIKYGI